MLCFASQGLSLYFAAVRIIKTSQEKRNFFRASHLFGVFSVVAGSFLKYKKFFKFRARNFHFPKCKKFFRSGTFYFSISESFFLNTKKKHKARKVNFRENKKILFPEI